MKTFNLTFVAGLILLGLGCSSEEPQVAPEVRPVRVHRVELSGATISRSLAGVSRAGVESRLSFRVSGTVDAVHVVLGDSVRRGQALARLDPTDYELKVGEAKAGLAQGQANLRKAEADYERARALYENENVSKSELDAARAGSESAQAAMESGSKRLEQANQQLGYTILRAPSDGAIASVSVEVNENAKGGDEMFLLTAGKQPEIVVAVPEMMIGLVAAGQEVEASFDALPGRVLPAKVTEVGVAVTGAASTFQVTVRLDESDPGIRSGMAAEVTFRVQEGAAGEIIIVPGVAVGEDDRGRFVYVVERGDGGSAVVRRRSVEVGRLVEGIEIVDGLEPGELIVTAGVRRLSEGMVVRYEEPAG